MGITINVMSLCTGIGGIEKGLMLAGRELGIDFRTVCMVEREVYATSLLLEEMEEGRLDPCPIWTDLKTFAKEAVKFRGKVDVITGGYPCQPFSVASSKRMGVEDPRHLFPDICRIIEAVQPLYCFFENVEGHAKVGFKEVYGSLRFMGYRVEAGLYTASEVGAPHRRKRLFIMANRIGGRCGRGGAIEESQVHREEVHQDERRDWHILRGQVAGCLDSMGDSETVRLQGVWTGRGQGSCSRSEEALLDGPIPEFPYPPSAGKEWAEFLKERPDLSPSIEKVNVTPFREATVADNDGRRQSGIGEQVGEIPSGRESGGRVGGHDGKEEIESPVCGTPDGVPDWLFECNKNRIDRLRALGNSVMPIVASVAFIDLLRKLDR